MESLVKEGSIGAVLYKSRIITEDHIRLALEEQRISGCRFGEALVRLGVVTQEDIDWALSSQLDLPYVRLSEEIVDREAVALVPASLARKHNLMPIIRTGDELHIALADPLNKAAVEEVERLTGCRVTVSIPIMRELRDMLDLFYGPAGTASSFGFVSSAFSEPVLEKINGDLSGECLLEHLVHYFIDNDITSLAFRPAGDCVLISARRGRGRPWEVGRFPVLSYPGLLLRIRKSSGIQGLKDMAAEGSLTFRCRESDLEFGVFLVRGGEGECLTLKRRLPGHFPEGIPGMGLSPEKMETLRSFLAPGKGMVLLASRNRAERTRLLDLVLDEWEAEAGDAMVLGGGIGKGKRSFTRIPLADGAAGGVERLIASLADHDPDLIALEELADDRVFMSAWKAAMRGCLVVAGISCSDVGEVLEYLVSARPGNPYVAAGIRGIVACTVVNTLCPRCRESRPPAMEDAGLPAAGYFHAPGCEACGYSGVGGKRYLLDLLPVDRPLREAFASDAGGDPAPLRGRGETGCRRIADELRELLLAGEISPEEFAAAMAC